SAQRDTASLAQLGQARSNRERRRSRPHGHHRKPPSDHRQPARPDRRSEALPGERALRRTAAPAGARTMKPLLWFKPHGVLTRRAFGVVAIVATVAVVASCAISRPGVTKRMFLLQPDNPAAAAATKPVAVRVGVINVASPFRGKAFVYRTGELKYESDF